MLQIIASLVRLLTFSAATPKPATIDVSMAGRAATQACQPHDGFRLPANTVYVDSSFNQHGYWTSIQDPIKGCGDTMVVLIRRYGDGSIGSGVPGLIPSIDGRPRGPSTGPSTTGS